METDDPFETVEADPLTGTTPDLPPVPTSDESLPPGVEPGMLGGTAAPDPDAAPEPEAAGENGGEAPAESPSEPPVEDTPPPAEESGAEDGTPVPPPAEEPETVVEETPPPPAQRRARAATAAGTSNKGGAPSRDYFIFEEMEIDLGDGKTTKAYVRRRFGNEEKITARNGPNALRAAGRAIGAGYEGHLVPVPVSMWNPQPVSTKQRDDLSVSVG